MVAESDQQILIQFFRLVGFLQFDDLVQIQSVQFQIQGIGHNLRLENILLVRKGTGMPWQVVIDLHKTQGDKPVEPGIGNLLHGLLIAIAPDQMNQGLPLAFLRRGKHHAVNVLGAFVDDFLFRDAVLLCLLRHTGNQFASCPDSIFFDGILIHGVNDLLTVTLVLLNPGILLRHR